MFAVPLAAPLASFAVPEPSAASLAVPEPSALDVLPPKRTLPPRPRLRPRRASRPTSRGLARRTAAVFLFDYEDPNELGRPGGPPPLDALDRAACPGGPPPLDAEFTPPRLAPAAPSRPRPPK